MENVELPEDLKNPRRLFGMEYVNRYPEENIDPKEEVTFKGNEFTCSLKGQTGSPPEMEKIIIGNGANVIVIYYSLDEFLVTGRSGKSLDLVSITPEGWKQKSVSLTEPDYKAPEIHTAFSHYQIIDIEHQECVVSNAAGVDSPEDADTTTKIGLWNTLVSRYFKELGMPAFKEGVDEMRNKVLERRKEIFDALDGTSNGDPKEIALRSFNHLGQLDKS